MTNEVAEFLVALGRLIQRHQVYPDDHPALEDSGRLAAEKAAEALEAASEGRELRIASRRGSLAVEGEGRTDADSGVRRTLARSLHRRHAANLRVKPGVSDGELRQLGRWLAGAGREPEEEVRPTARGGADVARPPRMEHLLVELLPYEALRLRRSELDPEEADEGAERIWRELAAAAHGASAAGELEDARLESSAVGSALADRLDDGDVARDVRTLASRILRRLEPLRETSPDPGSDYARRLDRVLSELEDGELRKLLGGDTETEGDGDPGEEAEEEVRGLILEAAPHLSPENLQRLVQAADDHEYLEISSWLLRVLGKLVRHARSDSGELRGAATRQVRQQVRELVVHYHGDSPHASGYAAALRRMSRPVGEDDDHDLALAPPSSGRLLRTGLEADCGAGAVREAWDEERRSHSLRELVAHLAVPPETGVADDLRRELLEREEAPLETLLSHDPPALEAAEELAGWSRETAVPALLDVLAEAERRQVRRFAFDQLASMGERVRDAVVDRLGNERWYVRRNLLALLARVAEPPFDFSLDEFMEAEELAVRREAIRLALRDPRWREPALEAALEERDGQTLMLGISAALEEGFPPSLVPRLAEVAGDEGRPVDVRRRAARALGESDDDSAREALLDLARRRRWPLFWRYRIRSRSEVVLEALSRLASRWSEEPGVREILEQARASDDPALREAVEAS